MADIQTPLSDMLESMRVAMKQERTPAYGDALALCRRLERQVAALTTQAQAVTWNEYVETACALIKAADDAAVDGDYMLDSNDCIKVLRGQWKAPLANDCPPRPQPTQQEAQEKQS